MKMQNSSRLSHVFVIMDADVLVIRGATQKFPKFECRAKTACSTVVGL
jgi:hypothetical protein